MVMWAHLAARESEECVSGGMDMCSARMEVCV